MTHAPLQRMSGSAGCPRAAGFSLIELLTVMFIITLLIAILIPSLNSARAQAKKLATRKTINVIEVGLELFKNDNERDFRQTNGYPPSFVHPPIPGFDFDRFEGRFPFIKGTPPVVYGAHWLPAMLMGVDRLGYVQRRSVSKIGNRHREPWRWYLEDPLTTEPQVERAPFYLDTGNVKTVPTDEVLGKENRDLFPDWDTMKHLPVIVDAFDQPILYYAANANGRMTNMVEDEVNRDNVYTGGLQQEGPPFYFHQDNHGFTGETGDTDELGWDFGEGGNHPIADPGDKLDAAMLTDPVLAESAASFARFILDKKQERGFMRIWQGDDEGEVAPATPLRPVNPESFLLISAGRDGLYGRIGHITDDVTNFPLSAEP